MWSRPLRRRSRRLSWCSTCTRGGSVPPGESSSSRRRGLRYWPYSRTARFGTSRRWPRRSRGVRDADWATRYLEQYRIVRGAMSDTDNTERALREGMDGDYFSSQLSHLRRALRDALGSAAAPYLTDDGGRRPHRYRLALAPEQIRFANLTSAARTETRPGPSR